MTYFKLSSWKISTWLPLGRERQGRLRELRRAACSQNPSGFPGAGPARGAAGCKPGWLLYTSLKTSPALAQSTRSG